MTMLNTKHNKWIVILKALNKNQRSIDALMHKRLGLLELENKALDKYMKRKRK